MRNACMSQVLRWTRTISRYKLPARPKINELEITEVFIKGGGKGGQAINKTNSKVQLKHLPTGIVVESQFSRSREDNRKRAREILALKVEEVMLGGKSRAQIVAEYERQKARKKKQKGRANQRKRDQDKLASLQAKEGQLGEQDEAHSTEHTVEHVEGRSEQVSEQVSQRQPEK